MSDEHRILLVDDEPDVLEALAVSLRRAREFRATVDTATSAPDALQKLAARPYRLVIADHRMPGTSGTDLLAEVSRAHPGVVRLLITGHTDAEIALEAMERARIHYYLQKPWDHDELRVTVLDALTGGWKQKL